jgi:hypothetical protein
MKPIVWVVVASLAAANVVLAEAKEASRVQVYAADRSRLANPASDIEGCRLLQQTEPVLEQESARAAKDPYRRQREAAGSLGGNVLLVFSDVVQRRPSLDCSPRDTSPECLENSQTWYRTTFGYYACSPEASARIEQEAKSSESPGPIFSWKFRKKAENAPPAGVSASASPAPKSSPASSAPQSAGSPPPPPPSATAQAGTPRASEFKAKILSMMEASVGVDVIVAWVASQAERPPLSADDVIDWKKSGIDEKVIRAAVAR